MIVVAVLKVVNLLYVLLIKYSNRFFLKNIQPILRLFKGIQSESRVSLFGNRHLLVGSSFSVSDLDESNIE
jgi:hypothetical protein